MMVNTANMVSMTEANQNFSKVARLVDQYGRAVVFKNNAPRYLIIDFAAADKMSFASDVDVINSAEEIMNQFDEAFKELAK